MINKNARRIYFIFLFLLININQVYPQGNDWLWAKEGGGRFLDRALDVKVDALGNSYVTGFFSGDTAFLDNSYVLGNIGINSVSTFFAKYNKSGNLVWAKSARGIDNQQSSNCKGNAISLDAIGNIFITGFYGNGIIIAADTLFGNGIFIAKYDTSGQFIWSKSVHTPSGGDVNAITTDSIGNSYFTGNFIDTAIFEMDTLIFIGRNVFVAKYDPSGNLVWAIPIINGFNAGGICLDKNEHVLIEGSFSYTAFFGGLSLFATSAGPTDIFIAKYDTSGQIIWAHSAGGLAQDISEGICIGPNDNVFITGTFYGVAYFDADSVSSFSGSTQDIFVAKYDSSGIEKWVRSAGGLDNDQGKAICSNNIGDCYVTGSYRGIAEFNGNPISSSGISDIFISKYDFNGVFQWVERAGSPSTIGNDGGHGISIDTAGNCYVVGSVDPGYAVFGQDSIWNPYTYAQLFIAKIGCNIVDPQITIVGNQLQSTIALQYQWYRNGYPITGSTSQNIIPVLEGNYFVVITDATGCKASSNEYLFLTDGLNEKLENNIINVFPNPTSDKIEILSNSSAICSINVRDILNRIIYSVDTVNLIYTLDIKSLKPGIYFLEMEVNKRRIVKKIIKE